MLSAYYNQEFVEKYFPDYVKKIAGFKVVEVLSGVFYVEHRNDFDFNGIIKAVLENKLRYEGECFYNEISGVG